MNLAEDSILREAKKGMKKDKADKLKSYEKKIDKVTSFGSSLSKQKITKRPSAKGIRKYSAVKAVRGMADAQGALVREVEVKEIVRDDRSLYFNGEFVRDFRKEKKWLS